MILSLYNRFNNQGVKIRILYSRNILDQKATPAVRPLPKISQRADFFTVGPVLESGSECERLALSCQVLARFLGILKIIGAELYRSWW